MWQSLMPPADCRLVSRTGFANWSCCSMCGVWKEAPSICLCGSHPYLAETLYLWLRNLSLNVMFFLLGHQVIKFWCGLGIILFIYDDFALSFSYVLVIVMVELSEVSLISGCLEDATVRPPGIGSVSNWGGWKWPAKADSLSVQTLEAHLSQSLTWNCLAG